MSFEKFRNELATHWEGGYHSRYHSRHRREHLEHLAQTMNIRIPDTFADFVGSIGSGFFFGGALKIDGFGCQMKGDNANYTRFGDVFAEDLFPIGDDGSGKGCFCLEADSGSDEVYEFLWQEKIKRSLSIGFLDWIEAKPQELFDERIYQGFLKFKNVDELYSVMEQRAAFSVRLISAERVALAKPTLGGKNVVVSKTRVFVEVIKKWAVPLKFLTVIMTWVGDTPRRFPEENISFSVESLPVGVPTILPARMHNPRADSPDPELKLRFEPVIDIGSPTWMEFPELSAFLESTKKKKHDPLQDELASILRMRLKTVAEGGQAWYSDRKIFNACLAADGWFFQSSLLVEGHRLEPGGSYQDIPFHVLIPRKEISRQRLSEGKTFSILDPHDVEIGIGRIVELSEPTPPRDRDFGRGYVEGKRKTYRAFDPARGISVGCGLFYECLGCGEIIPSMPQYNVQCECRNITIDIFYGRFKIKELEQVKLFSQH